MTGMIAVIGGYGDVGRHAARWLTKSSVPLRIGGRDAASAAAFATELGGENPGEAIESRAVDFREQGTVDRFAAGCRVLVNCAGPSRAVGDRLADAALRAGADYVDAAGDDVLHSLLDPGRYTAAGRVAVLSAGLRPGLSALFPRAIAEEFDEVHGLTVHLGLLDRFTATAADEYLQGTADGFTQPLAAWRDGPRAGVLTRCTRTTVPFFPGEVSVLPQLTTEDRRLATALGLASGDWYTVVADGHVRATFDRVHGLDRVAAVAALCRSSGLDLAGRDPFVVLVAEADGIRDGRLVSTSRMLRGRGNAELTGVVTALAALAVSRGDVPHGRHFAAETLDPAWVLAELAGSDGPAVVSAVGSGTIVESGAL